MTAKVTNWILAAMLVVLLGFAYDSAQKQLSLQMQISHLEQSLKVKEPRAVYQYRSKALTDDTFAETMEGFSRDGWEVVTVWREPGDGKQCRVILKKPQR